MTLNLLFSHMPHCMVLIRMAYKIRANSQQNSSLRTTDVHSEGDKWWMGEKKAEVFGELRSQCHSVHRQSHTGWGEKPENVVWYIDTGVTIPSAEIHSYVLFPDTDFHVETAWSPYLTPLCALTPCYVINPRPEHSRTSGWLWQGYWSPTFEWGHCRHF
jgi:hypothetical protein